MKYPLYNNGDLFLAEKYGDEHILNFSQFINDLNFSDLLTHKKAIEVVAYVDKNGTIGLSSKQNNVLSMTLKGFNKKTCNRCQCSIELDELVMAYSNGDLCSYCAYSMSKDN